MSNRWPSGSVKYSEYTLNGRMWAGAVTVPPAASTCASNWSTSARDVAGTPRLNSVELGGPAARLASLAQIGALVQAEQQASVEGEEGDRPVGPGDLVVKLLPHDALSRPASHTQVEGD